MYDNQNELQVFVTDGSYKTHILHIYMHVHALLTSFVGKSLKNHKGINKLTRHIEGVLIVS